MRTARRPVIGGREKRCCLGEFVLVKDEFSWYKPKASKTLPDARGRIEGGN
jgi:hypothetical protein